MRITPSLIVGVVFVGLLVVRLISKAKGGLLPPHEFAYGTALPAYTLLPERVDTFLSLPELDPDETEIETYVGTQSAKNLKPLVDYLASRKNQDFRELMTALKGTDQLTNQKEKAVQLVATLLPFRDLLRDEANQDNLIVFVHYGLKQPASLSEDIRAKLGSLVKQLDTAKQSAAFDSGECPTNYLLGNINIYPLAIENTFWHRTVDFCSPESAPILEVRFMGLKGIFRYLLDEMTSRTRDTFVHLDGESL